MKSKMNKIPSKNYIEYCNVSCRFHHNNHAFNRLLSIGKNVVEFD